MTLTRTERINAIAAALWGLKRTGDVKSDAIDIEAELEKMGYALIKRRYSRGKERC